MNEVWRDVKGFKGLYKISNLGRILSCKRVINKNNGRKMTVKEKIRKPIISNCGYEIIYLHKNGSYKIKSIHRLVAEHFLNRNNKRTQVNHKDGNKLNNRVSNLEWCTAKENINHSFSLGLSNARKGELSHFHKLKDFQVNEIRRLYKNKEFKQIELANMYGVSQPHISAIVNKKYRT